LATTACPREILLSLFQASASNLDGKLEKLLLAEHSLRKPSVPEKMMQGFPGADSRDRLEAKLGRVLTVA
jgi:hypothetical protein